MGKTVRCVVAHDWPPLAVYEGFVLNSKESHLASLSDTVQAATITVAFTQENNKSLFAQVMLLSLEL